MNVTSIQVFIIIDHLLLINNICEKKGLFLFYCFYRGIICLATLRMWVHRDSRKNPSLTSCQVYPRYLAVAVLASDVVNVLQMPNIKW